MTHNIKIIYSVLVVLDVCSQCMSMHYTNDTIDIAQLINEDFRLFQRTGRKIGGRESRRLLSFDTKNDNIEVSCISSANELYVL